MIQNIGLIPQYLAVYYSVNNITTPHLYLFPLGRGGYLEGLRPSNSSLA